MQKLIIVLISIFLFACTEDPEYKEVEYSLHYDLSAPSEIFLMPNKLKEISGIHLINSNLMACIQDEDGIIFLFNLKTKSIEKEIKFAGKGDYEDLEIINNDAYVIQSNGTIFEIKNFLLPDFKVNEIKTDLHKGCNVEGLTHIKNENLFLIACKDKPAEEPREDKAVYAFNLSNKTLEQKAYFKIKNKEVKGLISQGKGWDITMDIKSIIDGDKAIFRPSAIALHPFSNEYYLLSSVNKLICILDMEGMIKNIYPLDNKYFNQPEGICFGPNGDLYISNEASGGTANILKFNYEE